MNYTKTRLKFECRTTTNIPEKHFYDLASRIVDNKQN